jgi:hypothetical protein
MATRPRHSSTNPVIYDNRLDTLKLWLSILWISTRRRLRQPMPNSAP